MPRRKKAVTNDEGNEADGWEQLNSPGSSTNSVNTSPKPSKHLPSPLAKPETSLEPGTEKKNVSDDINSEGMGFDTGTGIVQEENKLKLDLHYLDLNFGSNPNFKCPTKPSLKCIPGSSGFEGTGIVDHETQSIVDGSLNEIFQCALTETCDSVVDSVVNKVVDQAFKCTREGMTTDFNKMNNDTNIEDDEVQIYCEEYKTSGQVIKYLAKGSSLRTHSALPYMPQDFKDKFIKLFKQVFLPYGFPESVSADYAEYQTWDTLQAFFSTLTGALTTHAVMKGVGVGDATATAASAAITWLLKDGTGLVGKILFAWWKGTDFDHNCKKWRLFADILNDVAMFLECLTPHLRNYSVIILCTSTAMKSLVGVAGGATRAALTQHQAIQGNMADVSAKDGSQEACVNLIASFIGIFLLLTVADGRFKWDFFIIFVFCHIMCNYRAVRAVQMATLNVARFVLIVRCYLVLKSVGSVKAINRNESVFIGRGLTVPKLCGYDIKFGVSMTDVRVGGRRLDCLVNFYKDNKYFLYVDQHQRTIHVFLKTTAKHLDILRAFYHALLLGIGTCMNNDEHLFIIDRQLRNRRNSPLDTMIDVITDPYYFGDRRDLVMKTVGRVVDDDFPVFYEELLKKGWNTKELLFVVDKWRGVW